MMLCQWLYTSDKSISRLLNSMVRWSSRYWQPEERWRRSTYKLEFSITLVLQYALFIKFRSDQKSMKMIWTNDKPSLWSGNYDHLHGLEIFCYDQSISSVISKTCVAESWNTQLVSIACAEIVWFISGKTMPFPLLIDLRHKRKKNYFTTIDTIPFNFCITQLHAVDA